MCLLRGEVYDREARVPGEPLSIRPFSPTVDGLGGWCPYSGGSGKGEARVPTEPLSRGIGRGRRRRGSVGSGEVVGLCGQRLRHE